MPWSIERIGSPWGDVQTRLRGGCAREFLSSGTVSFAEFCLALFNLNEFVYVN